MNIENKNKGKSKESPKNLENNLEIDDLLRQKAEDIGRKEEEINDLENKEEEEVAAILEMEEMKKREKNKGVVYLSSIPPFMNPNTLRKLWSGYGVERIYLQRERIIRTIYKYIAEYKLKHRKKIGGNRKMKYTEGWVEFTSKTIAKNVANTLNTTSVGGKKRHNLYRDDIWNIRYLSKFKWHHLIERTNFDKKVREQKLKTLLSQSKKETNFYLEKVDQAKAITAMENRRIERKEKATDKEKNVLPAKRKSVENKEIKEVHRIFKQRKPLV